jgi:SnoaL-like domain
MSTSSFGAPADFNYDPLLRDHLDQVFNERNAERRLAALVRLYNDDAVVIDPDGTWSGHQAISQRVGELQTRFPDDFSFRAAGPGLGLSGVAYLPWRLGPPNDPAVVSGVDVAHIRAGRIQAVYVLIDPVKA